MLCQCTQSGLFKLTQANRWPSIPRSVLIQRPLSNVRPVGIAVLVQRVLAC